MEEMEHFTAKPSSPGVALAITKANFAWDKVASESADPKQTRNTASPKRRTDGEAEGRQTSFPKRLAAVALAFDEIGTPSASGRETCVQKFENAYQRKEIEKPLTHFKSIFTTRFIKRFSQIKFSMQTIRAFLSHTRVCSVIVCVMFSWRRVEIESRFLRTLYASLPWFCVQSSRFLCEY